ncbi:MAG: hypothetical protein LBN39_09330 [Planctomycetaceae bacterium]|nr:hypothetical protein [Planctomycetaceae bacterium]
MLLTLPVSAQEPAKEQPAAPVMPPATPGALPGVLPPVYQNSAPALPRMNPAVLMKMRNDLTFELQNTQRTLGLIDPGDTELKKTLSEQQSELVNQLKDINTQLKSQGIPLDGEDAPAGMGMSGLPGLPQKRETLMGGGAFPPNPAGLPALNSGLPLTSQPMMPQPGQILPQTPPQPFDQDHAWNNSPWVPQPSKELTELKQTVESLRSEIGSLKESVKALETQIQLLNRNILLSQPK